jgi:hypothetical protein
MNHLQSALGDICLIAFAWLISENRRAVDWRSAGAAPAMTPAAAVQLLEIPQIKLAFALVNRAVEWSARRRQPARPSCSVMLAVVCRLTPSPARPTNSCSPSRRYRS